MSRTWIRAPLERSCGCCLNEIATGQPMLIIQVAGLASSREFIRCSKCAGETMPADLPALPRQQSVSELAPMTPLRSLAKGKVLPYDYSARRIGEREPGDDDE